MVSQKLGVVGPNCSSFDQVLEKINPLVDFLKPFLPDFRAQNFRLVTLSSVSLSEIASNMALNLLVSMMCLNANTSNFQHYRTSLFRFQLWLSLSLTLAKHRENPLPCVLKSPSSTAVVGQLETRNDTGPPTTSVLLNQTGSPYSLLASDSWANCSFESIVLKCSQFTNQFWFISERFSIHKLLDSLTLEMQSSKSNVSPKMIVWIQN